MVHQSMVRCEVFHLLLAVNIVKGQLEVGEYPDKHYSGSEISIVRMVSDRYDVMRTSILATKQSVYHSR